MRMQSFRVYTGEIYAGKLIVDNLGHMFRDRHGNLEQTACANRKVQAYKQLRLVRTK